MALKDDSIGMKVFYAIVFGMTGYILGVLLGETEIFPSLPWESIGLFLGVLVGLFKEKLF